MNTHALKTQCYEFNFPDVDTLVCVETTAADLVTIRATRNTFSETRKDYFIRELAAEGFIPEGCRWRSGIGAPSNIRWIIDWTWLELSTAAAAKTRRFMFGLIGSALVLWTGLLTTLLLTHAP
jgi:hypothetical protein